MGHRDPFLSATEKVEFALKTEQFIADLKKSHDPKTATVQSEEGEETKEEERKEVEKPKEVTEKGKELTASALGTKVS